MVHGGGHERGLRSGSLNVGGIVGFGAAARIAMDEREAESARVVKLRDRPTAALKTRLPGVHDVGSVARRLPNTANVRFEGADAEAVAANMDPVAVSWWNTPMRTGSPCVPQSLAPLDSAPAELFRATRYGCCRRSSATAERRAQPVDRGPAFRLVRKGLPHGRSRQSSEGPQRSGVIAKRVDGRDRPCAVNALRAKRGPYPVPPRIRLNPPTHVSGEPNLFSRVAAVHGLKFVQPFLNDIVGNCVQVVPRGAVLVGPAE